jgi:tRNA A37 threonylcarbamoyltransferase TsaD
LVDYVSFEEQLSLGQAQAVAQGFGARIRCAIVLPQPVMRLAEARGSFGFSGLATSCELKETKQHAPETAPDQVLAVELQHQVQDKQAQASAGPISP